jgi:hypothetical protein
MIAGPARAQEAVPPFAPVRYDGHQVVRVTPKSVRELRLVHALSDDAWTCTAGREDDGPLGVPVDLRFSPEALPALRESGIEREVLIEDVQALIDRERVTLVSPMRGTGWFDDYKSPSAVSAYADTLIALRPDLASRVTFGQSLNGRPMWGMRITARSAVPAGSKPKIVLIGAQHSREWITVASTMYLADGLVRRAATDARIMPLLERFEFVIVPISNPDGYDLTWTSNRLWRKNRRVNGDGSFGVDLNRNWGASFGGAGSGATPSSDTYHGPSAFSEPETAAMRDFMRTLGNVVMFFDVHSYGQLIMGVRGDAFAMAKEARSLESLCTLMQGAMYDATGKVYLNGPIYRTIYPVSGGASDWAANDVGTLGLSFELRDDGRSGFILPASQIVPTGTEMTAAVLSAAEWAGQRLVFASFADGVPTKANSDGSTQVRVQFNRGVDQVGDLSAAGAQAVARVGRVGPFALLPLITTGSDNAGPVLAHALPAGRCGAVVQWHYRVPTAEGGTIDVGVDASGTPFEATLRDASVVFFDDFEIDRGWQYADTSATSPDIAGVGAWVRDDPNGTTAQSEDDHTPGAGTRCAFTGQQSRGAASGAEVSGKTTLISPVFNLGGASAAEISLWVFYSNGRQGSSDDPLTIDVSFNGNAANPSWVRAVTVAALAPPLNTCGNWVKYVIPVQALRVPSSEMRVRVVANDQGVSNVVEVMVDDVTVTRIGCDKPACFADFDGTGLLNIDDLFIYLDAWFVQDVRTDVDHSGRSTLDDLFIYLNMWFAGCD